MEEERETLFLIDFEAVEDGDKMRLKPQSRKYGMSALFDTHLAQNWFFRQAGRSLLVRILILNAKNKYVGWVDFVLHRNENRFLPVFRPCKTVAQKLFVQYFIWCLAIEKRFSFKPGKISTNYELAVFPSLFTPFEFDKVTSPPPHTQNEQPIWHT